MRYELAEKEQLKILCAKSVGMVKVTICAEISTHGRHF